MFFISFGIYMTIQLLSMTFYYRFFSGKPYIILLLFCIALLVVREVLVDEMPVKMLPIVLLCALLAILIMKDAPRKYNVFFVPYIFAARNISFKDAARFSAVLSAFILIFVSGSSLLGIIENHQDLFTGRLRNYLGFRYPLFPATVLFNIIALTVFEKGNKMRWRTLIVLGVVNYVLYYLTDSRLCYYTAWVVIGFGALLKLKPGFFEKLTGFNWIMVFSFPICFFVSVGLSYLYTPFGRFKVWNETLGDRLALGHASIVKYGFSLLGRRIHWVGNGLNEYGQHSVAEYSYVDCMFLQVLQRYGIVFSAVMLILITVLMYKLYRHKCWILLVIFSVIAFHAMIDDLLFELHYCTFWLLLSIFFKHEQCPDSGNIAIYTL